MRPLRRLSAGSPPTPLPGWLRKWAALVLEFIEQEAELLADRCGSSGEDSSDGKRSSGGGRAAPRPYTQRQAKEAAAELRRQRLRHLAITLDRARLFLRLQVGVLPGGAVWHHLTVAGAAACGARRGASGVVGLVGCLSVMSSVLLGLLNLLARQANESCDPLPHS